MTSNCSKAESVMVEIQPNQMEGGTATVGGAEQNYVATDVTLFTRREDEEDPGSCDPDTGPCECDPEVELCQPPGSYTEQLVRDVGQRIELTVRERYANSKAMPVVRNRIFQT
jgi:hypothetical protein